jgi:hypothetical protein
MIETDHFIITQEQYDEFYTEAKNVGVSLDYYLMEFCTVEGEDVYV